MRLGRRSLRLFDRGDEVVRLQKALHELGYDVGEIDGYFGYLTQDALAQFQREHRLVVDGKAGPQVLATLFHPELKAMRQVHVVRAGERLIDVARTLGVTEEYLRRSNRLTRRHGLYEGRRLIVRQRFILGVAPSLSGRREAEFLLRRAGRHLTAFGGPPLRITSFGELVGESLQELRVVCDEHKVTAWVVVGGWAEESTGAMSLFLRRRSALETFVKGCRARLKLPEAAGLFLDLPGLQIGDGSRFMRLVRKVSAVAKEQGKSLIVGVPLPARGARGVLQLADLDWPGLQSMVDGIVVQTHRPVRGVKRPLGPEELRRSVKSLCARVPHWKLLLGVGLGALETEESGKTVQELTFQKAMAQALGRGVRPTQDSHCRMLRGEYTTPPPEEAKRTLWIPNAEAVFERVQVVEAYNLQGIVFSPLGAEDPRVWSEISAWTKAYRHEPRE